jgi:hypothetical protein
VRWFILLSLIANIPTRRRRFVLDRNFNLHFDSISGYPLLGVYDGIGNWLIMFPWGGLFVLFKNLLAPLPFEFSIFQDSGIGGPPLHPVAVAL